MRIIPPSRVRSFWHRKLTYLLPLILFTLPAFSGTVQIASPTAGSTSPNNAVNIVASASESKAFHLEIWDNGKKVGNVFSSSVNGSYTLSSGSHTTTILAVTSSGHVLNRSSVSYTVANGSQSGSINIASPTAGSTSISAVTITASTQVSGLSHLEIWDNGNNLGSVFASSVNGVYVLPNGSHVMTIQAVSSSGTVISQSSVNYTVAENCVTSATVQCDLDQVPIDNRQDDCDPAPEHAWVANPCGGGIQGSHGADPIQTDIQAVSEAGTLPNQGNLTLNGRSLHLSETRNSDAANVLFRGETPTSSSTTSVDTHWTMDEYVYLPTPAAHQAFEMDAQYSINGIWTKFYTECAFNMDDGKGYWGVFDSETGGWIFLNGKTQGGQTPPIVPCNRNQFSQPWTGSTNPSFSGWHHIAWTFLRNSDGTVTYQALTFDAQTTQVNFSPISKNGGLVNDNGNFSALVQLDGVTNADGQYDTVDAYVDEVSLTHTP